jgi:hypothetical protein
MARLETSRLPDARNAMSRPFLGLLTFLSLAAPAAADLRFVSSLPGEFIDISNTGTPIAPVNDGEFDIVSTIGNTLFPAGNVRIGMNGGVRFGPGGTINGNLSPINASLPASGAFSGNTALLAYWDDFIATNGPLSFGAIHHEERNGMLIIQWTNVKLRSAAVQDRITFQVQVPASGGVLARFVYPDILGAANGGSSATIGYQALTQSDSVQHSLDAPRAVGNGTVLSLIDHDVNSFVANLPGQFIDISSTGTALNLSGSAVAQVTTNVRNQILAQGQLGIGLNGAIRLEGTINVFPGVNVPLPNGNVFGGLDALVPFWDDLEASGGTLGNVYVQELADRLVVQWDDVGFAGAPVTERTTFQVQIFDESDVLAQFIYEDVEGTRAARGASATIGYQGTGGPGVQQVSFNTAVVDDGSVLTFLGAIEVGTTYCVGSTNSRGLVGHMRGRGNRRVSNNNLFLDALDLPFNSAAFFIVSRTTAFVPLAGGSQGNLCLGGAIGRGVGPIVNTGSTGRATAQANLLAMPSPTGAFAVAPGDTLSFQCWHRDVVGGVATSNFSNALQVHFEP